MLKRGALRGIGSSPVSSVGALVVALVVGACAGGGSTDDTVTGRVAETPPPPVPVTTDIAPQPDAAPPPAPAPPQGAELIATARTYLRVGACAGDAPLPDNVSESFHKKYCKKVQGIKERFAKRWQAKAQPFFDEIVPGDIPKIVLYPFGGGDLISAMVVFRDFDELTTLSLEPSGDPRGIDELSKSSIESYLHRVRNELAHLVSANHSITKNMIKSMRSGKLPTHLIMALAALDVHGFEPVSLRYFTIEPDGSLHYLERDEIDAITDPDWDKRNVSFGNVELQFVRVGEPDGKVRIYRHIQGNLDDEHLTADGRILAHLKGKGTISVITKAASFLLWWDTFDMIRDYLLDNMEWMVSDATGIPPSFAVPRGFEQQTWGKFAGPILRPGPKKYEMIKLWKDNPKQKLKFQFGYPDAAKHGHLMVTRKKR